ncbi:hypothetical protein F3Y22_tig00112114pilonHSYRG00020 [Hibiscus syriacus]|uniref:RNA polymerase subunit H/Rpb5 C-terminal domain-containing protein n=1 Tax=Hibiscus syriacus TaxID=106335 RepID=A0A6A2X5W4_HIBSY|nr:hypothetical protein F3Y22_tig00112114pilonHSYRG00020 [Hibiscus syriacus]
MANTMVMAAKVQVTAVIIAELRKLGYASEACWTRIADLYVNITKHYLMPKHQVLSAEEKQNLLNKYDLEDDKQPPHRVKTDPIARYHGLEKGEVVKATYINTEYLFVEIKKVETIMRQRSASIRKQIRNGTKCSSLHEMVCKLTMESTVMNEDMIGKMTIALHDIPTCLPLIVLLHHNGWGTDEKAIISVLGHRNAAQRKQIRAAYEELYQEDLIKRLESELSGDFERAVYRGYWIGSAANRDAVFDTNIPWRKMLLLTPRRHPKGTYDGEEINTRLANSEAKFSMMLSKTRNLTMKKLSGSVLPLRSNCQVMNFVLVLRTAVRCLNDPKKYFEKSDCTRAEKDLKDTKSFIARNSVPLDQAVAKDTSGDYKALLLTLLGERRLNHLIWPFSELPNKSKEEFLATLRHGSMPQRPEKVLRNSIQRLGTDEDALTVVIVTRAEKDLKEIKELYCRRSSVRLERLLIRTPEGITRTRFLLCWGMKFE